MSHDKGVAMSFNLATILTETALATPEAPVHLYTGTATTYP
jgi:hypothetical protein